MLSLNYQKSRAAAYKKRKAARRRKKKEEEMELMEEWEMLQNFSVFMFIMAFFKDSASYIFGGNKNKEIPRVRKDLKKDIIDQLGPYYFRRAYRMNVTNFFRLHSILEPHLLKQFFPHGGGKRDPSKSSYLIRTDLRLSIAIRYFAGASPLDLMITHGVSFASIYSSVWGVVDAVNKCDELKFEFPNHSQQKTIARGFKGMSGAGFSTVIGAIDGILIWILKPTAKQCKDLGIANDGQFRCHRKDKYGLNMQAICDHKLRFIWFDIRWPGASSDFMAWVTSKLCIDLEKNGTTKILLKGMTLVGDNAYVKTKYMATPLKGMQHSYNDAYNFYLSQLRITIERAFGVFVHRWAILRGPLAVPVQKVGPLVMCLMRLHNFCIDCNESLDDTFTSIYEDAANVRRVVGMSNTLNRMTDKSAVDQTAVGLDNNGRPSSLLDLGHHFNDAPRGRRSTTCAANDSDEFPMDQMLQMVRDQNLLRPGISSADCL